MQSLIKNGLISGLLASSITAFIPSFPASAVYTEAVVLDSGGKPVVPFTNCDVITDLNGLYRASNLSKTGPDYFVDLQGHRSEPKIPTGAKLQRVCRNDEHPFDSAHPFDNLFLIFEQDGKEGVCDGYGKVLLQPKYKSVNQICGDDAALVEGDNADEEIITRFDGTILGRNLTKPGPEYWQAVPTGAWFYKYGVRAVNHGDGTKASIMDLTGKVFAVDQFDLVDEFFKGVALAGQLTDSGPKSLLINTKGEIIKEFPAEITPSKATINKHYIVFKVISGKPVFALLDVDLKEIIPFKYKSLSFDKGYYFASGVTGNDDQLDIFDDRGVLLLACTKAVKISAAINPAKPDDGINLSSTAAFLAERTGSVLETTGLQKSETVTYGITSRYGLADKAGNWLAKPLYTPVKGSSDDAWKYNQHVLDYWQIVFSKDSWLRAATYPSFNRTELFKFFLNDHNLIGMSSADVAEYLGKPDSVEAGQISYCIYKAEAKAGDTGSRSDDRSIDLRLDPAAKVVSWRFRNPASSDSGEWQSANMMCKPALYRGQDSALEQKKASK